MTQILPHSDFNVDEITALETTVETKDDAGFDLFI